LPWSAKPDYLIGEIARNLGSKTPIRLVSSAKAGYAMPGWIVKRRYCRRMPRRSRARFAVAGNHRLSTTSCDAWKNQHPDAPLAEQDLVITVPASFDPAARELTVESARAVGLDQAILLEEPQAALYSWIEKSQVTGANRRLAAILFW